MNNKKYLLEKFEKIIKNQKLSHFYIIESKNNEEQKSFMFDLVYKFFKKDQESVVLKKLIKKFIYPNFYYLDAHTKVITKEDILEMKLYFNKTSLIEEKKIYVINGFENISYKVANSLLDFFENPISKNHLSILLTCDCNLLLPTILSRSQIFSLEDNYQRDIINLKKNKGINDELDTVLMFLLNKFQKEKISDYYISLKKFFLFFLDTIPEKKIFSKLFLNVFGLNKIKYFIDDFLFILTSFFLDLYYYKNNLNFIFPKYLLDKYFYNKLSSQKIMDILYLLAQIEKKKIILEPQFCFMALLIQMEKKF